MVHTTYWDIYKGRRFVSFQSLKKHSTDKLVEKLYCKYLVYQLEAPTLSISILTPQ